MGSPRRRDVTAVAAAFACASLILAVAPVSLVQDSWLTLVGGRTVSNAGIPSHDLLAAWTYGRAWIDQQWLAQLAFYRAYTFAGMTGVVLFAAAAIAAAWLGALALALRRGASGLAVLVWAPATALAAPWAWQVRAQAFALPLFVALLALLFADARARTRRVFLALLVVALWGNVHGTALLGAALVLLHALVTIGEDAIGRRLSPAALGRAFALGAGAFAALALNPYGLGIVTYYRTMLVDPPFASLAVEWKHTSPALLTAPFYVLATVSVILAVRHRRRLTASEKVLGTVLLLAAVDTLRSTIWFALAALVVVPPLVREPRLESMRYARPARLGLVLGAGLSLTAALVALPGSVAAHQRSDWPTGGSVRTLSQALARDPDARVLVDDRHADYLLWRAPELERQLLADVRFELLSRRQLQLLAHFESHADPRSTAEATIVVLDPQTQRVANWQTPDWRPLYADSTIAIFEHA